MKVEVGPTGFSIAGTHVPWSAIIEVFVYKVDVWSYDIICLGFRISGDGTFWSVGEGWSGYRTLLARLPDHLPGIRTDWFSEVAFPAFESNRTTIWGEAFTGD